MKRPRFSLRSLVILVLLIASGLGLLLRSDPWVEKLQLKGHQGAVLSAEFARDGQEILTACDDLTLRIWDAESGLCSTTIKIPYRGLQRAIFSPHSDRILTVSQPINHSARVFRNQIWEVSTGMRMAFYRTRGYALHAASFSPDGKRLVVPGYGELTRVVDISSGDTIVAFDSKPDSIVHAAYSPDSNRILTTCTDGTVSIRNGNSGQLLLESDVDSGGILLADFTPSGSQILTLDKDHVYNVRSLGSRNCVFLLKDGVKAGLPFSVKFSREGQRVQLFTYDTTVPSSSVISPLILSVWDAKSGKRYWTKRVNLESKSACGLGPKGRRVCIHEFDAVKILEAKTGTPLAEFTVRGVNHSSWSPNGKEILIWADSKKGYVYHRRRPEYWWGIAWLPEA